MKTSENFRREFKAGNYAKALQLALAEAIELEITTWVVDADLANSDTPPEPQPGNRIVTKINIVDGNIQNEVGSAYLKEGPYSELWDFHRGQVEKGREIISKNLQDLQSLFTALTTVLQNQAGTVAPGQINAASPSPAPRLTEPNKESPLDQSLDQASAIDVVPEPTPDLFAAEIDLAPPEVTTPVQPSVSEPGLNFVSEIATPPPVDLSLDLLTDLPELPETSEEPENVTQPPLDELDLNAIVLPDSELASLDLADLEVDPELTDQEPITEPPIAEESTDDLASLLSESTEPNEDLSFPVEASDLDNLDLEGIDLESTDLESTAEPLDESDADLLLDLSDLEQLNLPDAPIFVESNFPPTDEDEPPTDPFADRSIGRTQADTPLMSDLGLDLEETSIEEPISSDDLLLLDDAILSEEEGSADDLASFDPDALDWNSPSSEASPAAADLDAFADLNSSEEWDSLDETFGSLDEAIALPGELEASDSLSQAPTQLEEIDIPGVEAIDLSELEEDRLEDIGLEGSEFDDPNLLFAESQTVITIDDADLLPQPEEAQPEALFGQTDADFSSFNDDDDLSNLFGESSINEDDLNAEDLLPGIDLPESPDVSPADLQTGTDLAQFAEPLPNEQASADLANFNDDDDLADLFSESSEAEPTIVESMSSAIPDLDDDALNALFSDGEDDSALFAALSSEEAPPSDTSGEELSDFDLDEDNPFADADFLAELGDSDFDTTIEEPSSINTNSSDQPPSAPSKFPPPPPPPSWRRQPPEPPTDR